MRKCNCLYNEKLMNRIIICVFLSSFSLGQNWFQKVVLKTVSTFDPTIKKTIERLNESNGEKAELTFQDLEGREYAIDDYLGKVVLVNMWATWCSPCVKQIPDLNFLQEKYRNDNLVILSITDEDRATVNTFLTKHSMNSKLGIIKYDDEVAEPFRHFRRGRPVYFLVDRNGIVQSGDILKPSDKKIENLLRQ